MKHKLISKLLLILATCVVLLLFWAASEHRLRPAYIGIAKFENKIKGIDGISSASLAKVKGDARRHSRMLRSHSKPNLPDQSSYLPFRMSYRPSFINSFAL